MRNVMVFNQITLDGYFTDKNDDMSWAHKNADAEWQSFVEENAKGDGELLFGRKTYQMMESYWPTPQAAKDAPVVAERMNSLPKLVFSRSLDKVTWKNTTLLKDNLAGEIRKRKQESGPVIVIMGSGTIVSQLAQAGLIDEYQLVLYPLALGSGRTMFEGVETQLGMKRTKTRAFGNGNMLLVYEPAKAAK